MDIHLNRANANLVMNRLVAESEVAESIRFVEINGGGLRNAIPRESFATIVLPTRDADAFTAGLLRRSEEIKEAFHSSDPDMTIACEPAPAPAQMVTASSHEQIVHAIRAVPNGVFKMSDEIPDLVETSSNLAKVSLQQGRWETQSLQRSSVESGKQAVGTAVANAFQSVGASVEQGNDYPGWAPNANSAILNTMREIYQDLFGETPHVAACHAGLECGIILQTYPQMDAISFGPTIRGAHSPDEKVQISSVQKFWRYLLATLQHTPQR